MLRDSHPSDYSPSGEGTAFDHRGLFSSNSLEFLTTTLSSRTSHDDRNVPELCCPAKELSNLNFSSQMGLVAAMLDLR